MYTAQILPTPMSIDAVFDKSEITKPPMTAKGNMLLKFHNDIV